MIRATGQSPQSFPSPSPQPSTRFGFPIRTPEAILSEEGGAFLNAHLTSLPFALTRPVLSPFEGQPICRLIQLEAYPLCVSLWTLLGALFSFICGTQIDGSGEGGGVPKKHSLWNHSRV